MALAHAKVARVASACSWMQSRLKSWAFEPVLCRVLFGDFKSHAQLYGLFTLTLGTTFGAMDGPAAAAPAPDPPVAVEAWKPTIPAAPRELGFWRQFILTTPGVALALRLGVKGQQLKASPKVLLLTMVPTLWGPLALYLFVGYPLGIRLNQLAAEGR